MPALEDHCLYEGRHSQEFVFLAFNGGVAHLGLTFHPASGMLVVDCTQQQFSGKSDMDLCEAWMNLTFCCVALKGVH